MSSELQLDVRCLSCCGGAIWWTLTKERQAWRYLQVKLCDPCLSALSVPPLPTKALHKYSSFPFLACRATQHGKHRLMVDSRTFLFGATHARHALRHERAGRLQFIIYGLDRASRRRGVVIGCHGNAHRPPPPGNRLAATPGWYIMDERGGSSAPAPVIAC